MKEKDTSRTSAPRNDDHITESLKLAYDTIQDEPLPERFLKLLEQLKKEEKS